MVGTTPGANPVYQDSELVFGLVAPAGTNLDMFLNFLERCIRPFGYEINPVRLSDLTETVKVRGAEEEFSTGSKEYVRLTKLMHAGNALRLSVGRGEFLALAAAKKIGDKR